MAGRSPERTRESILEAALAEFVAVGPAGARVDRIAAAAAINKRMIYHYFGSKEGLYAALLERYTSRTVTVGVHRHMTLEERLRTDLAELAGKRDWLRLLMWDALSAQAADRAATHDPAGEATAGSDATRRWVLADLDPAQLELSLLALTLFPAVFPQLTRSITGMAPDDPAFVHARSTFFSALARHLSMAARSGEKVKIRLRPSVVSR